MMQKKWFRLFIWFVSTALFFAASSIVIATYSADPTEQQIMAYMSGMMKAMEISLMGLSMTIEGDMILKKVILQVSSSLSVLTVLGIIGGVYIRRTRRR